MKGTVPTKIVRYADGREVVSYAPPVDVPDAVSVGRPLNPDGYAVVAFPDYVVAYTNRCLAGAALKSLLAKFLLVPQGDCGCSQHAAEMDRNGCDWCAENESIIVGWLREEATKRGLPFVDAAGRLLVRRAIANARRRHGQANG